MKIRWSAMLYDLLLRFEEAEEYACPLEGAIANMHPEDYAEMCADADLDMAYQMGSTRPATFLGMIFMPNTLAPEGIMIIAKHSVVVATVNIDMGVIMTIPIPPGEGKVCKLY